MRAADTQTRAAQALQAARQAQEGAAVLRGLQRQAERSYEMIQEILRDLERLDVQPSAAEFPAVARMMTRRRSRAPRRSLAGAGSGSGLGSGAPGPGPAAISPVFAPRSSSLGAAEYFSAPVTPATTVSFDGGALGMGEAASMSLVAARHVRTPMFGGRRPTSVAARVGGVGAGTGGGPQSRSEASLSRAQAVWSPQIAESSAFGSPCEAPAAVAVAVAMAAPRGLSVRTASLAPSLASSPVESQRSPTPVGSPHPVEAARMLRQVMDQPRMPPPPTIDPELQAAQQQQQQRMSTWSASSARTLADDTAGRGRVIARHRVAADLGLSVRSELERRV
ncbi:hypothetical protein LPJ66_012257, partial [Kickxella alabastrina]